MPVILALSVFQTVRRRYGIAPELYRGKNITCRKYAAVLNRKEKAANDPISAVYNRRCAAVRTECGRGTITKEFAEVAKRLAKEHKQKALQDEAYAKNTYIADMSREVLYAAAEKRLN